ncbi:MAG: signal recognition particle receptor subunit alpha [Candidatus Micrarchaeota archaeon]|nr:signal recognition particle receptor subunit alpha [Candidatus Micrarchaeota archaeon]
MDLGEGLRQALAKLSKATIIDAKTVKEFNKSLQKALLSSDVEVQLVLELTDRIEEKALKSNLPQGVDPRDYITNIVYEELVKLVGEGYIPKMEKKRILMMGLYGSGKTTTSAKLAKFYQDRGLSAGLICCDVSRPAAYRQLETLAKQANVPFFGIETEKRAEKIAQEGLAKFRDKDIVICDTSGRSSLDSELIEELKRVNKVFNPDEKALVISADTGQIAGKLAREFDNAVKISGVIVTKMDGSGKGGGALSAASAASAKVMFIGIGEKLGNIEPFNPNKFIGNLLGVPDIESLVKHITTAISESKMDPKKLEKEELNFETFYEQLDAMKNMGPLKNMFGMMGVNNVPKEVMEQGEERLKRYKVIIGSMSKAERKNERLLHEPGRVTRIAKGAGVQDKDVRAMVAEFNKMKKAFNTLKNDRNFKKKFKFG